MEKCLSLNATILVMLYVLFIQIFIRESEGSCLAPVNIVNGEIEYYIQQSEGNSRGNRKGSPDNGQVPDGTIAFVSCNEGYIISGRSNHTCLNGLWHLPEVTCTASCPAINLENGQTHYNSSEVNGKYIVYTTALIQCNPDYLLSGSRLKTCQSSKDWNGQETTCKASCPAISLENGQIHYNNSAVNGRYIVYTTALIQCNPDYWISGPSSKTCQSSKDWNGQETTCKVTCSAPTTIANGRVDYYIPLDGSTGSYRPGSPVNGQVPDNTLAYVFCDEGYITSHVHHVACILDGDWNAPVPTCTDGCQKSSSIVYYLQNGYIHFSRPKESPQIYPKGTVATFTCRLGFFLSGTRSATCQSTQWSYTGDQTTCIATCAAIPLHNGYVTYTRDPVDASGLNGRYVENTTATMKCNGEFYLSVPTKSRTCQSSRTWDGRSGTCIVNSCPVLSLPNGKISYDRNAVGVRYRYYTVATHTCDEGYRLEGYPWRECSTAKRWNGPEVKCIKRNPPPPPRGCFPAAAKVVSVNGKSVTMSELKQEDKVQTVSNDGTVIFTEVITFLQKQHNVVGMYRSLKTSLNTTLSLTGNHLIYARKSHTDKFHSLYADQVSIGDEVLVQRKSELMPENVTNISSFMMQGYVVPLTMDGNIIVDGMLASCYASFDNDLAHMIMSPIRWLPEVVEWIFGEDEGLSVYAKIGMKFGDWALPYSQSRDSRN